MRPTRSLCGHQPGDARDPRAQRLAWLLALGTRAEKQGGLQTSSSSPHTPHSSSRRAPVSLPFRQTALASLLFGAWPGLSRWTLPVLRESLAGWESPCFASCDQVPPLPSLSPASASLPSPSLLESPVRALCLLHSFCFHRVQGEQKHAPVPYLPSGHAPPPADGCHPRS